MQVNFTFGRITPAGAQVFHQHRIDTDAECARRILAALMTNTPKEHEQARSKATDGYAMAADVLEGSEV